MELRLDVQIDDPQGLYHFQVFSQGDPQQPWILFLHGFLGNRFEFANLIADLARDFFCIAFDLPGHGHTLVSSTGSPVLSYGMESTAAGIIRCLATLQQRFCCPDAPDHLRKLNPYLVGYSMGGRLGLYLLLKFPQIFQGGVIESASPGLPTPRERSLRLQQDYNRARKLERLDTEGFQQFLQQWYSNPLFQGIRDHPHYGDLIQQRQRESPPDLAQSLRYFSLGAQPSLWAALPQALVPIALVVGEWDHKFVKINQTLSDRCPTAQLHVVSGVSHNVHFGNPAQFMHIVRSQFATGKYDSLSPGSE